MLLLFVFEFGDVVFGFFFDIGVVAIDGRPQGVARDGFGACLYFFLPDYVFDFRRIEYHLLSEVNLVERHAKFVVVKTVERLNCVPEIMPEQSIDVFIGCDVVGIGEYHAQLVVQVGVLLVQHFKLLFVFGKRKVAQHIHILGYQVFDLRGGGVHILCKSYQLVGLIDFFERIVLENSEHEEYGGH
jgi:hypothetical protein